MISFVATKWTLNQPRVSQRTLTMCVGVVALCGVDSGVPQLPQTLSEYFD